MASEVKFGDRHFSSRQLVDPKLLKLRPSRLPDDAFENAVMRKILKNLSGETSNHSQMILQTVAEVFRVESAGMSLMDSESGAEILNWAAVTGLLEHETSQALETVREVLLVPISRDKITVGSLWVASHRSDRQFDLEDYRLIQMLAEFASVALKLEHQEPDRSSIMARFGHDIRSPLGTIIGFSNLMKEEGLSQAERSQFISVIDRSANTLLQTIDHLFELEKLIPAQNHSGSEKDPTKALRLSGMKILVVDDVRDNQVFIKKILEKEGATVDIADDGREGVEKAILKPYDLVVMDIQMPGFDGYHALQILKEKNYPAPIIALTAHSLQEERDRAFSAGFNDFTTKPIDREKFIKVVKSNLEIIHPSPKESIQIETPPEGRADKIFPSILVVEDDLDTRELVDIVAGDMGAKTRCAATAKEALAILESGFRPSLVLLDLTLPDMGGAELIKLLRSDDRWKNFRVIVVSGWNNLAVRAKEMGADGSLLKPFDLDELEKIISESAIAVQGI